MNDRYVLGDPLGGGGMAVVFLARDRILDRDVALKVLRGHHAENEELVERFRREARAAASLNHPNIVQVYDWDTSEDGRYYIAMEYASGGTLKDRIVEWGALESRRAAAVAIQIAEALRAAHERGIVHRDVKPQNVLVAADGNVKVADFGIARAASATTISQTSAVLGTVNYMSPEQATGEVATPQSDLYSLGVVLYEMLTGELPFDAETPVAVSMKHINEPPRPPRELDPDVPEGMNALVLKLLAKDPADRYGSAAGLVTDLGRVADGFVPVAGADVETHRVSSVTSGGAGARAVGTPERMLLRALAALAVLVMVGGLLGWGLLQGADGKIVGTLEGVSDDVREAGAAPLVAVEKARRALAPQEVKVPEVEGLKAETARERLADAGLGTAVRQRESSEKDEGRVLEQSVPAGREVEENSRLLLAVGATPDEQRTPDRGPSAGDDRQASGSPSDGSGGNDGGSGDGGGSGGAEDAGYVAPGSGPSAAPGGEEEETQAAPVQEAPLPVQEASPPAVDEPPYSYEEQEGGGDNAAEDQYEDD